MLVYSGVRRIIGFPYKRRYGVRTQYSTRSSDRARPRGEARLITSIRSQTQAGTRIRIIRYPRTNRLMPAVFDKIAVENSWLHQV